MVEKPDYLIILARPLRHAANNLLAAIGATAELMRNAGDARLATRAERIHQAAERLGALLRAYLALAAPPLPETAPAAVVRLVQPLFPLLVGPGREVTVAAEEVPPLALSHAALISHALGLIAEAAERTGGEQPLRLRLSPAAGGAVLSVEADHAPHLPRPLFLAAAATTAAIGSAQVGLSAGGQVRTPNSE